MNDEIAMQRRAAPQKRRGTLFLKMMLWMIALLMAVTVSIAAAVVVMDSNIPLARIQSWLSHTKPYACLIHLTLIAWLWWTWEALIARLVAIGRIHPSMQSVVLASRHRTIVMLLAVEVFVVREFPFSVIRMMQ